MSALKPCPLCGGEAKRSLVYGTARCGSDCCTLSRLMPMRDWQSLPRPKKAPRCPECGSEDLGVNVVPLTLSESGRQLDCHGCGRKMTTAGTLDDLLDQWRPE